MRRGVERLCIPLRGPLCAGEALLEARTQASVAFFQTRGPLRYAPTRIWRAMKFKVLLRKRGGARARAADREFFLEIRPFGGSCFLCLSIMLHDTTRGGGSWWSCQLIDPSGWGVGGMAGHAGPPVGPASDVVLPLHSLKKRGAT